METGSMESSQMNFTPIDTTERDALVIPADAIAICYNSDVAGLQINIASVWYSLSTKEYAESLVVGLWDDRGNYDASTNLFPSSGGSGTAGAVKKGDIWTVSVAGTLGGVSTGIGDTVRALVDTPGQTAANWAIAENNFGYTAENQANKATDFSTVNNTLYPSVQAVDNRITAKRTENGILANTVSDVGTDADLLEKTLKSYTLPGGTLSTNGSYVEIEALLTTAANGNDKTATLYFGGTLIGVVDALALNNEIITMRAKVMRSAAGAQVSICEITVADASGINVRSNRVVALTKTMADDQEILLSGKNGIAAANDVVAKSMIVKHYILTS